MNQASSVLQEFSCSKLKGVGPKVTSHLEKLGIKSLQDLLFHLPLRYEDRTHFKVINQLILGDHVQVVGEIVQCDIQEGRRKSLYVRIQDHTGYFTIRFFYFNTGQQKIFSQIGQRLRCFGEIRRGQTGFEMFHPEYHFLDEINSPPVQEELTPIYPLTEGLNQFVLRRLTEQALALLDQALQLEEYLPPFILQQLGFPELAHAIKYVHRPPHDAQAKLLNEGIHLAQQRLAFEELLAHQLTLAGLRLRTKMFSAPVIKCRGLMVESFLQTLSFQLTSAQRKVITQIVNDMKLSSPMLRLVQGDVGSGKTVVAAVAAFHAIESGFQVAMMAPTELLAEQHFNNFSQWCGAINLTVGWLTGSARGKHRETILQGLSEGKINIIIGTHALFQDQIKFKQLGLIIIDEQHRFGVDQRLSLLNKGINGNCHPHQLVMSATPIPRTLAMTAYADLDCSIIDELPPGRTPVKTIVLPVSRRQELIERIKINCKTGAQVYWVCTLIQESEVLQCQAAEEVAKELTHSLPELKIGLIHGRMKANEKESIMLAFKNKEIDLLVATTVIEVGVDVANASLMIIENSERLGLAQLHQLRGRVGRGSRASHCVLLYQYPISKLAKDRLSILRDHHDGFVIAQKDLELRGPGEVLGTRQTGLMQLKIANLIRDQHHLPKVQEVAEILLQEYPECVDAIIHRWLRDNDKFTEV